MMRVCIGGTFNILHKGHELLFLQAFENDNSVLIGLTSNELVEGRKGTEIDEYDIRKKQLESYLDSKGFKERYTIVKLKDDHGPAVSDELDAIVVSEETIPNAEKINIIRKENMLPPLEIITVKMAYAENGDVISSTRIKKGEMDVSGKLMREVIICVGSKNQVKITACENVFSGFFKRIKINGKKVSTEVPEQPRDDEVIKGAVQRAKNAMGKECDFGVGIEAGLFWNKTVKKYFDVQYCAVIDRSGRTTVGCGSGFNYPEDIIELVEGGRTVGEAMKEKFGIADIGKRTGAIGYLSREKLNRTQLTEQAVLMAMIPRIRSEFYDH